MEPIVQTRDELSNYARGLPEELPTNFMICSEWLQVDQLTGLRIGDIIEFDMCETTRFGIFVGNGEGKIIVATPLEPNMEVGIANLSSGNARVNNSSDQWRPHQPPKEIVLEAASQIGDLVHLDSSQFVAECRYGSVFDVPVIHGFDMGWISAYKGLNIVNVDQRKSLQPKIALALTCRYELKYNIMQIDKEIESKELIMVLDSDPVRDLVQTQDDEVFCKFVYSSLAIRIHLIMNKGRAFQRPVSQEFDQIHARVVRNGRTISEKMFELIEWMIKFSGEAKLEIAEIDAVAHNLNLLISVMTDDKKSKMELPHEVAPKTVVHHRNSR
uniref:Uncharacterized protein n=1 Tax=Ditylenchus dipsaci TaxID=166011 RepID=A0A915DDT9_9BILA